MKTLIFSLLLLVISTPALGADINSIKINKEHAVVLPMTEVGRNVYTIPVTIGKNITEPYLFDTGASGIAITERTLARYIANGGRAIKGKPAKLQLADGSIILADRWVLESLTIGKCTFKPAYVNITKGGNLFGAVLMRVMSPVIINYKDNLVVMFCPDKIK